MKMTGKKYTQPVEKPAFNRFAENLCRAESSDGYYALLKRGGKQFRRSLKTKDRKPADRRPNDLRAKIGCLKISPGAKLNFEQAASRPRTVASVRDPRVLVAEGQKIQSPVILA